METRCFVYCASKTLGRLRPCPALLRQTAQPKRCHPRELESTAAQGAVFALQVGHEIDVGEALPRDFAHQVFSVQPCAFTVNVRS